MPNRTTNKCKKVFKDFMLEELRQPANDNYIQQAPLPLIHANDNPRKDDDKKP